MNAPTQHSRMVFGRRPPPPPQQQQQQHEGPAAAAPPESPHQPQEASLLQAEASELTLSPHASGLLPPAPHAAAHAHGGGLLSAESRSSSMSTMAAGGPAGGMGASEEADGDAKTTTTKAKAGAAVVEEEVVVDRGGSQQGGSKPGKRAEVVKVEGEEEEGKQKAAGSADEERGGPALGSQPKSRSLPAVLRPGSYRGDFKRLLRRLARGNRGHAGAHDTGSDNDDDEAGSQQDGPKAPPSILSSLQTSVHSFQTSVHSFVHVVEDRFHRMPKWQFHLLVGSLLFLLCSLVLMTVITVVYGFGMTYPHIALGELQLALPFPHLDKDGSIPVAAVVDFNNPNAFPVRTEPATVQIFTLPSRSPDSLLGATTVPGLALPAHAEGQRARADFRITNVGGVKGGPALVEAVLKKGGGGHSFLYTRSTMDVVVKSLGFLPIHRSFRTECKILKVWGVDGDESVHNSDCFSRFTRRALLRGGAAAV